MRHIPCFFPLPLAAAVAAAASFVYVNVSRCIISFSTEAARDT